MTIAEFFSDTVERPLPDVLAQFEGMKIELWSEAGALNYKAPKGVVNDAVLKLLKSRKLEIIEYLETKDLGHFFYKPIPKAGVSDYHPLSSAQRRMVILNQLDKSSTAYNLLQVLKIDGDLDKDRLFEVIKKLVERHESLRTSFEIVDGLPVQRIHEKLSFEIGYEELDNLEQDLERHIEAFVRPFDLSVPPLFRFKLLKERNSSGKPCFYLLQDMHHIISDGVSEGVLVKEVNALYAKKELPDIKIQYKDFSSWQSNLLSSQGMQLQREYWKNNLSGELPVLNLPCDSQRPPVFTFSGDSILFYLDGGLTGKLYETARNNRVTLFTVMISAYFILLYKYTVQNDIIVGTPTAGRRHADVENTIGVFISTLALRCFPEPEKEFCTFLKEVGSKVLSAFDNQDYPFESIVDDINIQRDMSRNPVFDTIFNLLNMDVGGIEAEGLRISKFPCKMNIAQYDISIIAKEARDRSGIEIELNYCTSLFSKETISRFGEHYVRVLESIVCDRGIKLKDICILSQKEEEVLLYDFNYTEAEYAREKTINELFEEQAERIPDDIALVFGNTQMTYSGLNSLSNKVADTLEKKGVKRGDIVGVMIKRSPEMIAGILGILKTGGAYLPIDPEYPEDRVNYMLEDSKARVLLTSSRITGKTDFLGEKVLIDDETVKAASALNSETSNTSGDLAYVIYTSGSTGNPKGVMIEHKALINFIKGMCDNVDFEHYKNVLCLTTVSFDIFSLETHLPLTRGMKVVIANEEEQIDSKLLCRLIEKNSIDIVQMTPSRMQLLMSSRENTRCLKKVKEIIIGGEAFPEHLLKELNVLTNAKIYNVYGPTETTVWSTIKDLTGLSSVTVGKPISNTQIYIIDQYNKIQPVGVVGELCIGGEGLARGYLNRPELTCEKFIINQYTGKRIYKTGDLAKWLPNGEIKIAGRVDHQVKIRGYRVELEEIEKRILDYEGVKECVVAAKDDAVGNKLLAAYIITDEEINVSKIRAFLSDTLPEYMVPGIYMKLEQLPKTANGKIDRKALPEPQIDRSQLDTEFSGTSTETQKQLERIWSSLLKAEQIGINDNFFEIGGNSLLLVQMHAKLEELYPGKVSVAKIFAHPTIAKLALYIEGEEEFQKDKIAALMPVLPPEFFSVANGAEEKRIFRFIIDGDVFEDLKSNANKNSVEILHVLISLYLYLLSEVSRQSALAVQAYNDKTESIRLLDADFDEMSDFPELFSQIKQRYDGVKINNIIPVKRLCDIYINLPESSVVSFFVSGGTPEGIDDENFDLIFKVKEEVNKLCLECECRGTRINKAKIEELLFMFIKVIKEYLAEAKS